MLVAAVADRSRYKRLQSVILRRVKCQRLLNAADHLKCVLKVSLLLRFHSLAFFGLRRVATLEALHLLPHRAHRVVKRV